MPFKNFTIFGERCSGTCWITKLVEANFSKQACYPFGWKHFVHPDDPVAFPNTMVVVVVRNPIDWTRSFFKTPHHIPPENRTNFHTFLTSELVSRDAGSDTNRDLRPDGTLWKNILEMRKDRHQEWCEFMEKRNHHIPHGCVWVSYESVKENPTKFLESIENATGWGKTKETWDFFEDTHFVGNTESKTRNFTPVCYMKPKGEIRALLVGTDGDPADEKKRWSLEIITHFLKHMDVDFENKMSKLGSSFLSSDEQNVVHVGTWAKTVLEDLVRE
jgi:hypothetical protein